MRIAAVVLIAVLASAVAAASASRAIPASLVGTWTTTLTRATWDANDVPGPPAGRWGVRIAPSGLATILGPLVNEPGKLGQEAEMHVTVSGTTVVFGPSTSGVWFFDHICPHKGSYTWKVAGRKLTFKAVADDCRIRTVLLTVGSLSRR